MKIHSDILTSADIHAATRSRGMRGVVADVEGFGSRSRAYSLNVHLTGTSNRRPNGGTRGADRSDDYAATWDEWGMFLAALYEVDPNLIAGTPGRPAYADAQTFHHATGDRFQTLTAPYQHGNHNWTYGGGVQQCSACSAILYREYTYAKVSRTA